MSRTLALLTLTALLCAPSSVQAANILLVSDSGADLGIATALMADGHTVVTMSDMFSGGTNPALLPDLSEYDAVYWSQDGTGSGDAVTDAALITNLTDYVSSGGRLLVTGYDSIASPADPMLVTLLGGTGSSDTPGSPGMILAVETSLTVGVVDIRGVTPTGGVGDTDHLTGLGPDTVAVCYTSRSTTGAQWTVRTLGGGEVAYISNGSSSPSWTNTGAGGAGAYNAAIRNFASAADAAATEPGAPDIEFARIYAAAEGEEVILEVTVTDPEGDAFTFSWDTDGDEVYGELEGMTSYTIPAGTTDGDSTLVIGVQASDGTHTSTRTRTLRITNVAPRISSSPPTMTSVGAMMRYAVIVEDPAGDLDPPTFELVRGPSGAAFQADGTLVWIPGDTDVTIGEERAVFEIAVHDGDMGTGTQMWQMMVSANHLPSNVTLLYPANGIVIADPMPRLAVSDAADADYEDTITYFFELASDETFSDLVAEGPMITQTPGYTAYQLTEALPPGHYYWRAWAYDGFAESPDRVSTHFFVAGDSTGIDAGVAPGDGGTVGTDAGPPASRGGCSAGGNRSLLALGAFALLGLALRRRR